MDTIHKGLHSYFVKSRYFFIFALVLLSFIGCSKEIKPLEEGKTFEIKSILPKVTDLSLTHITLEFKISLKNPYSFPLKTGQFVSKLKVMNKEFLSINTPVKINAKANSEGSFTFPVVINFASLEKTLKGFEKINSAGYSLKGDLIVQTDKETVKLPVVKEDSFPIFKMPEIINVDVKKSSMGLFSVNLDMEALIVNKNIFPLDIRNIHYSLTFGEVEVADLKVKTSHSIKSEEQGRVFINGNVSAVSTFLKILNGDEVGTPQFKMSGKIKTPYGNVDLDSKK
ncbi:MAG: hypothetical protein HQK84_12585 [Nitrospinae bacterium]|nr:hypothetical protein [Nitrospinota bacterium]